MNTKTQNKLLLTLLLGLGALSCRTAIAAPFVQPTLWYVEYSQPGLASKAGGGIAAGLTLGGERAHEVSLEIASVPWELSMPGPIKGLGTTGSGHLMPVLLNYRYYLGTADQKSRFYFGATAGMSKTSGDAVMSLSGLQYSGNVSVTRATFGATTGVAFALTANVSVDLGYRYLQQTGATIESQMYVGAPGYMGPAGPKIRLPAMDAHILALGLRIRF